MVNNTITFVLLRLGIALSMFGHGFVRMPKLEKFSGWMVGNFQKSILPDWMVVPFSYVLPIAELLVGILLLIGLFTRGALIGGAVVMLALIFGTTLIESWDSLPSQLIHLAYCALLIGYVEQYNGYSLDKVINKRS
jgi:thiosulfate dehydrogenase [quinone] large subunit